MIVFIPIVEGQGEVYAVPALLYRIAQRLRPDVVIRVNPPIRVKASSFLQDTDYFQRQVELACAKAAQSQGHVLILLDCEDDCPATVGPTLLQRAQTVRRDVSFVVCLAYREYETWFLTAAQSLQSQSGLASDLKPPPDPERIRGAKEWLSRYMPYPYDPIIHQLDLTRAFDLEEAQMNRSFQRLVNKIRMIIAP